MFLNSKRLLALVLALVLVLGLLPASAQQVEAAEEKYAPTQEDYAAVDAVFDQIDAMEASPAKKNASDLEKLEAAKALVKRSENYVEGTLEQNGNSFTWWTEEGIRCVYSPRMRKLRQNFTPEKGEDAIINEPKLDKGGSPTGKQVYLIGPYYGYDDSFTNQYKTEATRIASAIGDTDGFTLYSGTAATIDNVAKAVSNGAVVIFDSHGATDYENAYDEYDFITGANYSYLCLNSSSGITYDDYYDGALYNSDEAWVNGYVIANHMTKNSPSGLLWMAICLGMGTKTMCEPLRAKGVEVVFGYSESVTFAGDYLFEEAFWTSMVAGKTVAQSISDMKSKWGNWDWSTKIANHYGYSDGYSTISSARDDFMAFPVVVSDEDTHPGQRTAGYKEYSGFYGADSLQTVKSTYTLFGSGSTEPDPTEPTEPAPTIPDTPAVDGATIYFNSVNNRVSLSTLQQTWYQNGITVVNEKSGSSNDVAGYVNPVRFYAGSTVTVYAKNMTKFTVNCSTSAYASSLGRSVGSAAQVSVSGTNVTITLPAKADSFTFRLTDGQVRVASITVSIAGSTPVTPGGVPENTGITGDFDGNSKVNAEDVITLLLHLTMPDVFPLPTGAVIDLNKDGKTNVDDAIHLLLHVSMPDVFPL